MPASATGKPGNAMAVWAESERRRLCNNMKSII